MSISIHREGVVGPDRTVEVSVPELQPGQRVSITVESEQEPGVTTDASESVHIIDLIKNLPGQRLFKTADEVDDYLRRERDSWDR